MSHDDSKAETRRKRDKIIIFTVNILIVKRDRDHRDYRRVTNFPQRLYLNERLWSYSLK